VRICDQVASRRVYAAAIPIFCMAWTECSNSVNREFYYFFSGQYWFDSS